MNKIWSEKPMRYAVVMAIVVYSMGTIIFWPSKSKATSQGPFTATASGDCVSATGVGTVAWTSPGNAFSDNSTYATVAVDGTTSNYLKCTNYGFSIPSGANIDGIVVTLERKADSTSNGGSQDAVVKLVKAGAIAATSKATATIYTTSDVAEDHGTSTDLWSDSFTPADINASNFGAAIAVTKSSAAGAAHTVSIDRISIAVYYSSPTLSQSSYRMLANADSITPGSALAAQNTAASIATGTPFRLRQSMRVDTTSMSFNSGLFKLQYSQQGADNTCDTSFTNETYVDVPTSSLSSSKLAGSATNDASTGTLLWGNPSSAVQTDGSMTQAGVSYPDNYASQYLKTVGYGFSVPGTATITGIEVRTVRSVSGAGGITDNAARLVKAGTIQSTNRLSQGSGSWSSSFETGIYGGPSDLWGGTWSPTDINNANFGFALSIFASSDSGSMDGATALLDSVSVRVYYQDAAVSAGIKYQDNASVLDGSSIYSTANDPTDGARTTQFATYGETNPVTNLGITLFSGNDALWDFALVDYGSSPSTKYCLRMVKSDGSLLDTYLQIPQVTITGTPPSSQGPRSPSTTANDASVGTIAWTNTGNVMANDGSTADAALLNSVISNYIKATNFGFTIPSNATITGVAFSTIRTQELSLNEKAMDNAIRLVIGGTIQTTDRSDTVNDWNTTPESYGGSSDLWGASLTPSDVNASNFGIAISAKAVKLQVAGGNENISLDYISCTVYYTVPPGPALDQQLRGGRALINGVKSGYAL